MDATVAHGLSDLLADHDELVTLMREHQEALLARRFDAARLALARYEALLGPHLTVEDEILLPWYSERLPRVPGGGVELFTAEHRKLASKLDGLVVAAAALSESSPPAAVIALLDREYLYKDLMAHHDTRERKFLYPRLDAAVNADERRELWTLIRRVQAMATMAPH